MPSRWPQLPEVIKDAGLPEEFERIILEHVLATFTHLFDFGVDGPNLLHRPTLGRRLCNAVRHRLELPDLPQPVVMTAYRVLRKAERKCNRQ